MKKSIIGADHEFHDKEFVIDWANRFVPTPERLKLFNIILSELRELIPENGHVVELGIGPGYLAKYLLESMPEIKYHAIDFSSPMLEIASNRLTHYSSRITYTQTDLIKDAWEELLTFPVDAIVSTWTLHDLGNPDNVESVYTRSARLLSNNGILLNGDFIKPEGASQDFEAGRFQIGKHLDMLKNAGFSNTECLVLLEEEIESPTAAQNYACFKAVK